jgi:hypothetical protein
LIGISNVLSAVEPLLLALMVKVAVPTVVGVPDIVFPEKESPPVAPLELTKL